MQNSIKLLFIGMAIIFSENIIAQGIIRSNISTLGSQFSNKEFSISQTAGQSSNTSAIYKNKVSFRQGFQQPIGNSSNNRNNELLNYTLYPSPNNGIFTLEIELLKKDKYNFEIINILGSKLYADNGTNRVKKKVNVSHLPSGVYILKILDNSYSLGEIKFVIY